MSEETRSVKGLTDTTCAGPAAPPGAELDPEPTYCAYLDESSAVRSEERQEYLVCAAVIPVAEVEAIRERVSALRLKGQIKLHWTDESEARRKQIVTALAGLSPMTSVVTHLSDRQNKTERFKRLCLEVMYYELALMGVRNVICEARTASQDKKDRAHIVALRNQRKVEQGFDIDHCRGGDDPLLWLPDIFLGAINSRHLGNSWYYDALSEFMILESKTADSY